MTGELVGRTVGILVAPGSNDADVAAIGETLRGVGVRPVALRLDGGPVGDRESRPVTDVTAEEFDGLVVPGGIAGADRLRSSDVACTLVRETFLAGRPVGSVGHGAWLLVEAGIAAGRTIAAAIGTRTGIANAGGTLAVEGIRAEPGLVTASGSEELAGFGMRFVEALRDHVAQKSRPSERESGVDRVVEQSFPASDPAPGPSYL